MKSSWEIGIIRRLTAIVIIVTCAGCSTVKTVPPLFATPPQLETFQTPRLLAVPTPPEPESVPIVLKIPKKNAAVTAENSIMRKGAVIKPGSSVVISVPASFYQRQQDSPSRGISDTLGFRTDGYFNVLEQYIERGLITVGLQAKDRSKFEAKLRDLRDSGNLVKASDNSYSIALASLRRDLDHGEISLEEFTQKAKQLRDKLLDPTGSSRNREEMTDISEVIRAAQDGEVMADYILQVNDLSVKPYSGIPLQLGARVEVQTALRKNPGLRIGSSGDRGNMIPTTLRQPWAQARFNAKLIHVKTGSIEWIGEYSIESLMVLDDGITITIGVRRYTSNGKAIVDSIVSYNNTIQDAYQRALKEKSKLEQIYQEVMQPVHYEGKSEEGDAIQSERRFAVEQAERAYARQLSAYQDAVQKQPAEAYLDWAYGYDVDDPMVVPDLLHPKTEQEQQQLLEHIKALGFKVTHDLLGTIKIAGE